MKRVICTAGLLWLAAPLALAQDAGSDEAAQAPTPAPEPAPTNQVDALPTPQAGVQADPQPTQAELELPMTDAELEAFGLDIGQGGVDTSIQISGFADFTVSTAMVPKDSLWRITSAPQRTTGYIGNFNVYIKKNLTDRLRTMGEVRFTYLPNGSQNLATGIRTDTAAADYSDYNRTLRWGGIEIERMYLEWSIHHLVALRVGQFLTPYGIWNVDHGSPTYIPIQRPFVIGNNWFPERQTGFEAFGRWDANAFNALGYHLTLSNGTGPISEYQDLDENKAIGGRLYWEYRRLGELRLGASGYYGRETGATWTFAARADGSAGARERIDTQFDALAFGADASWKYRGLQLQSEWIVYQRSYTEEGRTAMTILGRPATFGADGLSWGMYGLAGYRFSWLGVMPFVVVEHINGEVFTGFYARNVTFQAGLNLRPVDVLALKLVYYHVHFFEGPSTSPDDPLRMLQAQVAWAF